MSVMSLPMLVISPDRFLANSSGLSFRLHRASFSSIVCVFCVATAVARVWRPFPYGRHPRMWTQSVMDGGVPTVGWAPTFIPRGREVPFDLSALISTPLV